MLILILILLNLDTATSASGDHVKRTELVAALISTYGVPVFQLAFPPADWRRQLGRPRITWLSTVQQDLKQHHLTLPEAADLAQNRPVWTMMSTYGATQSWVACQKRRRRSSLQTCAVSLISLVNWSGSLSVTNTLDQLITRFLESHGQWERISSALLCWLYVDFL